MFEGVPDGSADKELPAVQETQEMQVQFLSQEDTLEEENGNLLQYFCQKNSMDTGLWQAIAQGLQSQTQLSGWCMHAHTDDVFYDNFKMQIYIFMILGIESISSSIF